MSKFRRKPIVIEAFQLSYEQATGKEKAPQWFVDATENGTVIVHVTEKINGSQYCNIKTLEGIMTASKDDYIIQGVNGEIYPCKPDIFEKIYEHAENVENTFIDRLLMEQTELNEKKAKLEKFINSEGWNTVDKNQRALLLIQLKAMETYSEVLEMRIIDLGRQNQATGVESPIQVPYPKK